MSFKRSRKHSRSTIGKKNVPNIKSKKDIPKSYKGYAWLGGHCNVMALALSEKLHKPIYLVNGYFKDEDGEVYTDPCHAVVKINDDTYLDASGSITKKELLQNCVFMEKPFKVNLEEVSKEEVEFVFGMEGVSKKDLEVANEFIDKYSSDILRG